MPTVRRRSSCFLTWKKYPPSLQYLLMTLGPIAPFCWQSEGASFWAGWPILEVYGRVRFFFYILIYSVIHLMAFAIGMLTPSVRRLALAWRPFFQNYPPDDYGHGLGLSVGVGERPILLLYWPCARFLRVSSRRILTRCCDSCKGWVVYRSWRLTGQGERPRLTIPLCMTTKKDRFSFFRGRVRKTVGMGRNPC